MPHGDPLKQMALGFPRFPSVPPGAFAVGQQLFQFAHFELQLVSVLQGVTVQVALKDDEMKEL